MSFSNLDKIVDTIFEFPAFAFRKIVNGLYNFFSFFPGWVKYVIIILILAFTIMIAILVWKNRHEWRFVGY